MDLKIGQNFLSSITLHYDSKSFTLTTNIENDEFDNTAKKYLLHEQNIATATFKNNIFNTIIIIFLYCIIIFRFKIAKKNK